MTAVQPERSDDGSVRARLIRAADVEVDERGVDGLRMEAVAQRAGVSRATAFRQLGSVSELLIQVALLRAERHIQAVHHLVHVKNGAFAKIEAALIYTARELPTDPAIVALIARHSASVHHPRVHESAVRVMGPVLEEGQTRGEIRTDVGLDDLIDFLVEQTYLAAEEVDRSEPSVRKRFRQFIIPALEAKGGVGGEFLSHAREVEQAVSAATVALENLSQWLRGRGLG
ncbi:TetR/AcrR family transcriptional regulator [Mycobacterium sp. HUMS_1102779]|uniref:TetR/AcrR family transcriptional regulator n=1 Tax=Mycobacterium sp. HUMS_1102779 TaxID=3383487 RepID=UPI00389A7CA8